MSVEQTSKKRETVSVGSGAMVRRLPIFRRAGGYCMDCYDSTLRKMVMVYPFIPRRNSKAPEYMTFRRAATGELRHFRFERLGDRENSLIYRQVRRLPNNRDEPRRA